MAATVISLTNSSGLDLRLVEVTKDGVKVIEEPEGLLAARGGTVTLEGPYPVLYQVQATAMNWYVYTGVENDAGFAETTDGRKLLDSLTVIDWDDNEHNLQCEVTQGRVVIREQDATEGGNGWSCVVV